MAMAVPVGAELPRFVKIAANTAFPLVIIRVLETRRHGTLLHHPYGGGQPKIGRLLRPPAAGCRFSRLASPNQHEYGNDWPCSRKINININSNINMNINS